MGLMLAGMMNMMAQEEDPNQGSVAKVTTKDALSYSRNSLTVIPISGMTNYDAFVANWAKNQDFGGKFDYNNIEIPQIGKIVNVKSQNNLDSIRKILLDYAVPKKVADYWVQYDGKLFKAGVLEDRAAYNKTDEDILKDRAAKLGGKDLFNLGKELMKNSFLLVAGPTVVTSSTSKKGVTTYSATSTGFVYHVDLNDEVLEEMSQVWLDESSSNEDRQKYENLIIGLESTATVSGATGTGKTPEEAITESLDELFEKLEKKVDKWQVVTTIYDIKPMRAKIGTKEGLKNSDRYTIFRLFDLEDGETVVKKVGYARATNVAENKMMADGQSPTSTFYQISGRKNGQPGMYLKQNKDLHLSVAVSGNFLKNALAPVIVDVDYLIHTSQTLGMMQYGGLSIGANFGKQKWDDKTGFWLPVSLHYGLGLHFLRWFELTPNVGVGAMMPLSAAEDSNSGDDASFAKKLAYYAHGGLKFSFQVWYPVSLFIRADYSFDFAHGEWWEYYAPKNKPFGFSLGAGVRVNF